MYAPERHQAILHRARSDGRVEVRDLAHCLAVTPETIRRDLTSLEKRGLLRRAHGGAIPVERLGVEPEVATRETHLAAEKNRIATAALAELPDAGSVAIDAGTTTVRVAELLPLDRRLTVITHSLPVAMALVSRPSIDLHLVGGHLRGVTQAAVGPWATAVISSVSVDVAFIGTNGVSRERGLTTPDLDEAVVKTTLIASARRVVVLADHSKFGRQDFGHVAPLSAVDTVITDSSVDDELAEDIEAAGPEVVRA
ncbi:DeoR/GlpR family DNA-binding transcription regulator [Rathayibacter toxicus]|uniref:Lactose phosphotransferase system repressor n=1 Tax=Rathayibacter toxicus TaxID=145458 RepID=A0A0C5BIE2_9MICO|nr:DeoR/GlpR family DNA-binding transcription regulator [Rathayibacter toxicus]AJM78045.1 D-beta-D-heptose 1-phosphate adenosyltransferase [Rathayibacter toxicus]ALS57721.1 D-beta-D-heptose 1-phosphate adenosyltransferase [Rathayibacter toxicus]KKM47305.1 D-beta-D-heptose 1-phosphate adenosyltransferase [Rathayibacter toxicus]PPG20606.1 DeoR/GlpR transcriptional regulator [Rathayibacter toxicus]PPG45709.1 DeoR/GlpR transcriptional regulator [Rathayibacter toxicus]